MDQFARAKKALKVEIKLFGGFVACSMFSKP